MGSFDSRPGRLLTLVLAVGPLTVLTACTNSPPAPRASSSAASPADGPRSDQLLSAVNAVNKEVAAKRYALHALTVEEVLAWFDEAKNFELLRGEREPIRAQLQQGRLPAAGGAGQLAVPSALPASEPPAAGDDEEPSVSEPPYGFEVIGPEDSGDGSPRIVIQPFNLPIVDSEGFMTYERYQRSLLAPDLDLASESFSGPPTSSTNVMLDPAVQVRVTPIELKGRAKVEPAERAAVKVEVRLTADTLRRAAEYFGAGFGEETMRTRMLDLLGSSPEAWVNLADMLPNWVGDRVNTFPLGEDTDVCYGAAREFYAPEQDDRHNTSTEASTLLLKGHYCLLGRDVAPAFGDYLSVPGQHAGRYVVRDPATGRDVSFSVQSGGNAPYRFHWLDEDFSRSPFGGKADPAVLDTRVDVWRRCR